MATPAAISAHWQAFPASHPHRTMGHRRCESYRPPQCVSEALELANPPIGRSGAPFDRLPALE
jgi:hypothetical protein